MVALDTDDLDWPHQVRTCAREDCDETFYPQRKGQTFCSSRCRKSDWDQRNRSVGGGETGEDALDAFRRFSDGSDAALRTSLRPWSGVPDTWDDWHGRLRLHPMHETQHIGCGERGLTVTVMGDRVLLVNHHTGDRDWITRAEFERLAEKAIARGRIAPVTDCADQQEGEDNDNEIQDPPCGEGVPHDAGLGA